MKDRHTNPSGETREVVKTDPDGTRWWKRVVDGGVQDGESWATPKQWQAWMDGLDD